MSYFRIKDALISKDAAEDFNQKSVQYDSPRRHTPERLLFELLASREHAARIAGCYNHGR